MNHEIGQLMRIGIDLGGTKIELVVLDNNGQERFKTRVATPKNYQGTLDKIVSLVQQAEQAVASKCSVGIGIPGCISLDTGTVKNANSTWLNNQPFNDDLNQRLNRQVFIANDANCFAVSEATDGAAAKQPIVFGVIIGTGCGAGIAINGKVHAGRNFVAGEWGHNPLPWMTAQEFEQTNCFCGKHSCIETFISGSGFIRDFNLGELQVQRAEDIMALVEQGNPQAITAFTNFIDRLARSLAHVINILDPDAIVLGGGLSNIDAIYQKLPEILAKYVIGGECYTPVLKNKYGCSSGVRGAAWLAD
ncbi:fructokinase [Thalassotalea agariperforans]